jgi:hypothetical protein
MKLHSIRSLLLCSAAAVAMSLASPGLADFNPHEGTNAGSQLWVCATPQPNKLTLGEYQMLNWVQVKSVGNVGEMGTQTNILSYPTWDDDVVRKQKGMSDAGDPTVEVARIPNDPGQVILRAQAKTKLNYAFKIVRDDAAPGGAGTVLYNRGLVTGPTRPMGANEDFDLEVFTLGLQQLEEVSDAATGVAPYNTVVPTITGTAEVGETLTAVAGTWFGDATITYTHQWRRNGVAIVGATASTYLIVAADEGKTISVIVTGKNNAGQNIATSAATAAVAP